MKSNQEYVFIECSFEEENRSAHEVLSAKQLGGDIYELLSIPKLSPDLNAGDSVRAIVSAPGSLPSVSEVVSRGGHRTVRLVFFEDVPEDLRQSVLKKLEEWGARCEAGPTRYYAVGVSVDKDYEAICGYLAEVKSSGHIEFETGADVGRLLRAIAGRQYV